MHSIITRIFPIAYIRHRHLCLYALCVVMSFSIADAEPAESYNHFQENYPQSPKQSPEIDPLTAYSAQYVVHGVVVMEDNNVYQPKDIAL